jgi:dienelactone hydrolase
MTEWDLDVRVEKVRTLEGVTALTVRPLLRGGRPSDGPLVLVVHGLGSRKERHLELCLLLARAGMTACALDACLHGERSTPEAAARCQAPGSPAFASFFTEAVSATAAELAPLAAHLGHVRYGVVGHSMGGFVALRAAVEDPRIEAVVSIAGSPDWAETARAAGLPPEAVAEAEALSPLGRADAFWPRPLLMLHGDADQTVPVGGQRRLHAALSAGAYAAAPDRLSFVEYPGVGHEFLPDMAERAADWMRRFLPTGDAD